ncbi:MAG TPA: sigma-70 family RNA polymerase sigma factor [Kofleriaceae bacterium]
MPIDSDEDLVERSVAGEVSAFTELVEKYQRLVFAVALGSVRQPAAAEDVAQEAFVEAWRALPRLRDRSNAGSWIAGIARNLARRWHRRTARRTKREAAAPPPTTPETPLDVALQNETSIAVHDALAEIPAAHREALTLFYVHGRSVAEVAAALGVSEDVIKQRLTRARRSLRAMLESQIESAFSRAKPSAGFVAVVAASVAATSRHAAASTMAGKVALLVKTKIAIGLVIIAAGVAWYLLARDRSAPITPPKPSEAALAASRQTGINKHLTPSARAVLLDEIRAAHRARAAETTAHANGASSAELGASAPGSADDADADQDYVQLAMGDILPSVMECYQHARERIPTLAGTLVINFTIEGERDVGGLVTEAAMDTEQSEIEDEALGECVQNAVFALDIEAPTSGGVVKVSYPFTFGRP